MLPRHWSVAGVGVVRTIFIYSSNLFTVADTRASFAFVSFPSAQRQTSVPRLKQLRFMSTAGSCISAASGEEDLSSINWVSDEQLSSNATTTTAEINDKKSEFSVLSWNILSQTASTSASNETFAYKGIELPPPQSWEYRLPQLCTQIQKTNADICCLQEMDDSSYADIEPFMKEYGYNGILQPKEKYAPAVATFWKKSRFQKIPDSFKKRSRTLSILLQDRYVENLVLAIINVHLEGHPHKVTERVQQIQHALRDVSVKHTHHGVVVCGDFNSQVHSSACSTYMNLGYLSYSATSGNSNDDVNDHKSNNKENCVLEWNQPIPEEAYDVPEHPYKSLKSAYPPKLFAAYPQEHFSYIRLPQWPAAGLDQIWHTGSSLKCTALKKLFSSEEQRLKILEEGLPSKNFPSDHLPVGVMLSWNSTISKSLPDLRISPKQSNPDKNKSTEELLSEAQQLQNDLCFDNEQQKLEFEGMLCDIPGLNLQHGQIPNDEQKALLEDRKKRRDVLLQDASEEVCKNMKRIFKLHREASKRDDEQ